jgi:hypothetical protein
MFPSTRFTRPDLQTPAVQVAEGGEPAPPRARSPVSLDTAALPGRALSVLAGTGTAHDRRTPLPAPETASLSIVGPAFAAPTGIVDAAMLQPADLHDARTGTLADASWARLRPPRPGGGDAYPSTALRRCERAVTAVLAVHQTPTVIVEYLAVYRSDGAHQYLRELREALAACRGDDGHGGRWTVLSAGLAGRESLRLRFQESFEYAGETITKDTYVAVARTGRVLVVVIDAGWESGNGHRELVEELITPAVGRAGILR